MVKKGISTKIGYMQLSKTTAVKTGASVQIPDASVFALPERVLQFGTGVLLRGLPDYFISHANEQKIFNGRVVVVKSTSTGGTDAFKDQDCMFTIVERGVVDGQPVNKLMINAAISRVVSANEEWDAILACAKNPLMQVIISNTTEVGITLVESDAQTEKPVSFPGRILAFLEARYAAFEGSDEAGMVIIPTELIVDNGIKLKQIVVTLAEKKNASPAFMQWLTNANDFCNSLVDCIVPGKLPAAEQTAVETELGYEDQLMIMSEPYRLWAIETKSERTLSILSFRTCNEGVVLAPDINKFRELKLRLLNATHTLSCGMAHLSGFATVKEAMANHVFTELVAGLMIQEISPLIVQNNISIEEAHQFAAQVIDRFRNPFIEHLWLNITAQFTSKMAMRVVPLIEKQYATETAAPELMALGFAAFIAFMKSEQKADGLFYGQANGKEYRINDDKAALLHQHWQLGNTGLMVNHILADTAVFGADLSGYPGFADAVTRHLVSLTEQDAMKTLNSIFAKKSVA